MTPYRKRISAATQRMAEDMLIRNMAVRTIDSYTYHVDRFSKHFGKLPEDLGPEEIRQFQLWMIQEKKCSWSSFNLSGMMHLSVNLLWGKDLTDSDRRLASDSANLSRP
jgi:hypothetical protein